MNVVDAECKDCGKPFRWLTGSAMRCIPCQNKLNQEEVNARRLINSLDFDIELD